MLPLGRHTLVALIAVPLALAGCKPKQPEVDIGAFLDAFSDIGGSMNDIQVNNPPDFEVVDAGDADAGREDVEDDADIEQDVQDVEQDIPPEACQWQIVQTIENPGANLLFGQVMRADGARIAISSLAEGLDGLDGVTLYESRADGPFEFEQRLEPSGEARVQNFGSGISFDDDRLVIGASIAEVVYVYDDAGAGFAESGVIEGPEGATDFGVSVAQLDDGIFIGAARDGSDAQNAGALYEVRPDASGFSAPTRLSAGLAANQFLGRDLETNGDVLIAGGINNARVYVPLDSGVLREVVLDGSPGPNSQFGASVLATRSALFVGAPGRGSTSDRGGVVFYEPSGDGWSHQGALISSSSPAPNQFGNAIAGHDGLVVVGASSINVDNGSDQVFVFAPSDEGDWEEIAMFDAPATPDDDNVTSFGAAVAVSGDLVFIGDPWRATGGVGTGVVFVAACR